MKFLSEHEQAWINLNSYANHMYFSVFVFIYKLTILSVGPGQPLAGQMGSTPLLHTTHPVAYPVELDALTEDK